MAICDECHKEMTQRVSCITSMVCIGGKRYNPIPYGSDRAFTENIINARSHPFCHDCSTPVGGYHHRGCDMEDCPKCHEQLISCECDYGEDKVYSGLLASMN